MSETLRRMGERADIVRTMQRAYAARGTAPAPVDQAIYDPAAADARPLIGRLIQAAVSRSRESLADATGVELTRNPVGLARALRTISDDGIRVWIDGALVIDDWNVQGSEINRARVPAGAHTIRVEYFEATGWAELRVEFARIR